MATELGSAFISVGLGTNNLAGDIKKAFGSAESSGSDAGKSAGRGFTSGFKGLVGAGAALVGAGVFGGFIAEAARASDATDKFKATMSFAGLKTTAIDAASKAAKEYADQTVYDLPTIQNTLAQLASNGVKDYTGLTKAAGNLNAVAGGNADTFKSVAMVMTQTAGAGKLTTENWNQLADAIPGAAGPLMKALEGAGAYTGNFRDAMAKGEITSEEFNAALGKLGKDPIAVEAAKSTETFEGAIGNLKATINGGLMSALDAIKPAVTGAISGLASGIGKVNGIIGGVFTLLKTGEFTGGIGKALGVEEDSKIIDSILNVRTAVTDLLGSFKSGNGAAGLGDFFAKIITGGAAMRDSLIQTVGAALPKVIGAIVAAAPTILNAAVGSFSSLVTAVITTVPPLLTAILGMLPSIISTLLGMLPTLLTAGMQLFTGIVQALIQVVPQIVSTLVAILPQIAGSLLSMLPQIIDAGLSMFMGIVQAVVQLLPVLIDAVMTLLPSIITTLLGMLPQIINSGLDLFLGVVTGLLQAAPAIINALLGMLPQLITTLVGMIPQLIRAAVQLFNGIVKALPIILPQLVDALIKIGPKLVSTLIGMVPLLFGVGINIIQGLIDGARSMIDRAVQAIKDIGGSMLKGIQDFLGIHSPSREFMKIGGWVTVGLAEGVRKKAPVAVKAIRDVAQRLTDAATSHWKKAASSKGNAHILEILQATQLDRAAASVRAQVGTLTKLTKQRDALSAQLSASQKRLSAAVTTRNKQATDSTGKLRDEFKLSDMVGLNASSIKQLADATAAQLKGFAGKISKLRGLGLNAQLIQQIGDLGSRDGGALADSLIAGGKGAVSGINGSFKTIGTYAQQAGNQIADGMYGAGINGLKGLVSGFSGNLKAVDQAAKKVTDRITSQVKKNLGIHSPSRVFRNEVGHQVGEGARLGILDKVKAVANAADQLVRVPAVPQFETAAYGAATGAGGAGFNNYGTIHVRDENEMARIITTKQRDAQLAYGF